jgi:hypothetical protein
MNTPLVSKWVSASSANFFEGMFLLASNWPISCGGVSERLGEFDLGGARVASPGG